MTETEIQPRYGIRTGSASAPAAPAGRPELVAREAAGLGLHHLAAAMEHRITRAWADRPDPLLMQLRSDHPEDLAAAEVIVKAELGGRRSWLLKAQSAHNRYLAPVTARRRAAGLLPKALVLRLSLIALLILPSLLMVVFEAPLAALVLTGAASVIAALVAGQAIHAWLRIPVQPAIRPRWLKEIRTDIVDATLLAILQGRGVDVDPQTALAAGRGWQHIRFVAAALDRIDAGPVDD
jgi:hypothetical protein